MYLKLKENLLDFYNNDIEFIDELLLDFIPKIKKKISKINKYCSKKNKFINISNHLEDLIYFVDYLNLEKISSSLKIIIERCRNRNEKTSIESDNELLLKIRKIIDKISKKLI